jgi:hypothetical protein
MMTPHDQAMDALCTLQAMRCLLDEPERWTQRSMARDEYGWGTSPYTETAACFCLHGARLAVTPEPPLPTPSQMQAMQSRRVAANGFLERAIRERSQGLRLSVVDFNDTLGRLHVDIVGVLDRAIELAAEDVETSA